MLARNYRAPKPAAHRFQIVLQHPPVSVFQEIDSLVSRPGEQWPQRALQHRNHYAVTGFAAPAGRFAKDPAERLWYIEQAMKNAWSRNVLVIQIESGLYRRQGKALTNFEATLPAPQSDLAQQIIKDPYNFDFLTLTNDAQERDLERGLLEHLRQFFIELGVGFAFVGSQIPLEVGGEDFRLDLLFYHLKLRCFVVIDLKMTPFKPEYAGKMNFYLAAVDDLLRHPDDKPSIGLVLCKTKNRIVAEYALRNVATPMGISEFRHLEQLPEQLKGTLPTIQQIEAELGKAEEPSSE